MSAGTVIFIVCAVVMCGWWWLVFEMAIRDSIERKLRWDEERGDDA